MDNRCETLVELGASREIDINPEQAFLLIAYMDHILEKNKRINLTGIKDEKEFMILHLLDSLSLLKIIPKESKRIMDVGTGGGFPGIPLAIMLKGTQVTLLDSTHKKLKVIEEIAKKLEIKNVLMIHGRAEELGRNEDYRGRFDVVVSRAVADLSILSEYCIPFVRKDGFFLSMKGKDYEEELKRAKKAITQLGGEIKGIKKEFLLQTDYEHVIIITEKIKLTPYKYPRHSGKIKKSPLS